MPNSFPLPRHNATVLKFLQDRRSNLAKVMTDPGPDEETLNTILNIGLRVPDHRKLTPWRLVVFRGQARRAFGETLADAYAANNPDHPDDRVQFEADRFLRAPVVIAVISAPKDCVRGTPIWEQQMSAAAVCMKLCLAAQASGFGAQWLTEWYAYDEQVNKALGIQSGEQIAGYIYIGTPTQAAQPRTRPNPSEIVKFA